MRQAGRDKRMRIWRHNGFCGSVKMAQANLQSIVESETATPQAKDLARHIITDLRSLAGHLKERVDLPQEGS